MIAHPTHPESPLLVTAAVIIREGRALITRRPDHKPQGVFWEFPGGKIDPDESPTEALQRELDVEVHIGPIIEVLHYQYDWGPVLTLAYLCRIRKGTPQNIDVAEHRWVPLERLHLFDLLPADKPLVAKLHPESVGETCICRFI